MSKKDKPLYIEIYEFIRNKIVTGAYVFGSRIPSKRELAAKMNVSIITVEHAYGFLCDEGYIESRERSGYYVIYKDSDFISTNENSHYVIDQSEKIVLPVYEFPYSVLVKTVRKVMLDYDKRILLKSPNGGCPELRIAISSFLAKSTGISVSPSQIIIGAGAEYLYSLVAQLLGKDRIFAIEEPSYSKIQRVYESNGVKFEKLKLGGDGILSSELEKTSANVLHVTPFNSYPSGVTASASKKKEYIDWASSRKGYIIEDNYDSEMTPSKKNEDTLFSISENENVIYLNTFSRTISQSVRVGYMVLPERLADMFEEKLGFYSCTVSSFEQYIIADLINSGAFERHINRVRRQKRKNKEK